MVQKDKLNVSRRTFLGGTVAGAVGSAVAATTTASAREQVAGLQINVNGTPQTIRPHPDASLAEALREDLLLTGTKIGCGVGECGSCTVHMNGEPVRSCVIKAREADGASILTIEGLESKDGTLHPLQQAFIENDALQCGFCTPGQIMAGLACIQSGNAGSPQSIAQYMDGNICRCGAHAQIVSAISTANGTAD
ncbi:MAG: (2Fe-2S)-binding protein [Pseudomonadota bacterium]